MSPTSSHLYFAVTKPAPLLKAVLSSMGWNSSFSSFSGEKVWGQISEAPNLG